MSKIFVVDDEETILAYCQQIFMKDGYDVTTFSQSAEMLKTVSTAAPDLILMDLHIPGERGLSLLNRISNEKQKAHHVSEDFRPPYPFPDTAYHSKAHMMGFLL
jgi:CheY-like chemotaxis protein